MNIWTHLKKDSAGRTRRCRHSFRLFIKIAVMHFAIMHREPIDFQREQLLDFYRFTADRSQLACRICSAHKSFNERDSFALLRAVRQ